MANSARRALFALQTQPSCKAACAYRAKQTTRGGTGCIRAPPRIPETKGRPPRKLTGIARVPGCPLRWPAAGPRGGQWMFSLPSPRTEEGQRKAAEAAKTLAMGEISAPPWCTTLCKQELSTTRIPPPLRISSAGPELGPREMDRGGRGEIWGCSGESEGNYSLLGMTLTYTRGDAEFSAAAGNPTGARSEGQGRNSSPDQQMNVSPAAQLSA